LQPSQLHATFLYANVTVWSGSQGEASTCLCLSELMTFQHRTDPLSITIYCTYIPALTLSEVSVFDR
jgi:hypothetical protein